MSEQSKALRFADAQQRAYGYETPIAAEFRRLHYENAYLLNVLRNIAATAYYAEEFKSEWCAAATGMVRMSREAISAVAKAEAVCASCGADVGVRL